MAKLPEPPSIAALAAVRPTLRKLAAGTLLFRLYFRGGPHPTLWRDLRAFGPLSGRFDPQLPGPTGEPSNQDRRIAYVGFAIATCLAEVYQHTRVIDRQAAHPWLVGFRLTRAVRLLDVGSAWSTRAGASMALASGPRPRAQRWARTIHAAYPEAEGIAYPSSMNANAAAAALWERAEDALPTRPSLHRSLADPVLFDGLRNAAADLGYRLV